MCMWWGVGHWLILEGSDVIRGWLRSNHVTSEVRLLDVTFTLGFRLPLGDVNGPSLEAFRNNPRNQRSWGETGLGGMDILQEFLHAFPMRKLLANSVQASRSCSLGLSFLQIHQKSSFEANSILPLVNYNLVTPQCFQPSLMVAPKIKDNSVKL